MGGEEEEEEGWYWETHGWPLFVIEVYNYELSRINLFVCKV